jgi:hypothetical protein
VLLWRRHCIITVLGFGLIYPCVYNFKQIQIRPLTCIYIHIPASATNPAVTNSRSWIQGRLTGGSRMDLATCRPLATTTPRASKTRRWAEHHFRNAPPTLKRGGGRGGASWGVGGASHRAEFSNTEGAVFRWGNPQYSRNVILI